MSVVLVTTDTLPSNVPKLDVKRTNWAIFTFCFQVTVKTKDLWGHLNGSTACPNYLDSISTDQTTEVNKWIKEEWMAKHLLAQWIPDLTTLQSRRGQPWLKCRWKLPKSTQRKACMYKWTCVHNFSSQSLPKRPMFSSSLRAMNKKERVSSCGCQHQ